MAEDLLFARCAACSAQVRVDELNTHICGSRKNSKKRTTHQEIEEEDYTRKSNSSSSSSTVGLAKNFISFSSGKLKRHIPAQLRKKSCSDERDMEAFILSDNDKLENQIIVQEEDRNTEKRRVEKSEDHNKYTNNDKKNSQKSNNHNNHNNHNNNHNNNDDDDDDDDNDDNDNNNKNDSDSDDNNNNKNEEYKDVMLSDIDFVESKFDLKDHRPGIKSKLSKVVNTIYDTKEPRYSNDLAH